MVHNVYRGFTRYFAVYSNIVGFRETSINPIETTYRPRPWKVKKTGWPVRLLLNKANGISNKRLRKKTVGKSHSRGSAVCYLRDYRCCKTVLTNVEDYTHTVIQRQDKSPHIIFRFLFASLWTKTRKNTVYISTKERKLNIFQTDVWRKIHRSSL